MSDGKGKGKDRAVPTGDGNPIKGNEVSRDPSMLSRVAASASGLTRSALAIPSNNELNDRAAAALSNTGKGQASLGAGSENGSAAWAENSGTSQPEGHQAGGPSGFRAGHHEEHLGQSEHEFSSFLDGIDSFIPSEIAGDGQFAGETEFGDVWNRSHPIEAPQPASITIAEQESRDGEAVFALLSGPIALNAQFEAPPEDDENYDWGLSAEQLSKLRAMTKELFPPVELHGNVAAENSLNLNPSFDAHLEPKITGSSSVERWREQWEGVLTRYTDEVWGGLLPLVKEARQEVEEMQKGLPASTHPKALRRLEAILGHLQKS